MRDPSADDAGDRAAASVPSDGTDAYGSCFEGWSQEDCGEADRQEAGAQGPIRQGSCREAPGPPFAARKSLAVDARWSCDQWGGFPCERPLAGADVVREINRGLWSSVQILTRAALR